MYFQNFSLVYYNFEINGKQYYFTLRDITKNVRIKREVLDMITVYDSYDMLAGESIETVSEKIYGTPYYHWVIMLVNQRYDYVADYPLSILQLESYLTSKYGAGNENAIHHYVNSSGYIVDSSQAGAISVSNREYEEAQNEKKRRIKIINPSVLPRILQQFSELM